MKPVYGSRKLKAGWNAVASESSAVGSASKHNAPSFDEKALQLRKVQQRHGLPIVVFCSLFAVCQLMDCGADESTLLIQTAKLQVKANVMLIEFD